MSDDRKVVTAAIRSILSALKDDPPADWRDSLYDAADALTALNRRLLEKEYPLGRRRHEHKEV